MSIDAPRGSPIQPRRSGKRSNTRDSKMGGRTNGLTNGLGRTNGLTNGLGRTNGLTNGLGRTNGLTNGLGRTNGLTNGLGRTNGLTNGLGRTNGLTNGLSGLGRPRRLNDSAISPSRISLILILAFVLIMPSIFLIFSYHETAYTGLRVDGQFEDWDDIDMYSDSNSYATPALNINNYAAGTNDAGGLFLYALAGANWMSSTNIDSLIVFIDADGNTGTGYSVNGIGADYVAEAYGWNGTVEGRQLGVFSGTDQSNWSAYNWRGLQAAVALNQIEIGISAPSITLVTGHSFLFMTKRGETVADICNARIALDRPALSVRQIPGDVNGIMASNQVMSLELRACGGAVDVTAISFTVTGVTAPTVAGLPAMVTVGVPVTLQVTAPVTGVAGGTFVQVAVSSVTGTGLATIIGERLAAYANAAPTGIRIDGAFGDWNAVTKGLDPADQANPGIDIRQHAAVNGTANAYFYLKTDDTGKMMGGSNVPSVRSKPSGTPGQPGTPAPLMKVSGEDMTRIYIDTVSGGQNIGGIGADYLIEIKGRNGQIASRVLYRLPSRTFIANINAGTRGTQLETGVSLTSIGFAGTLQYFMESTDWHGNFDRTAAATMVQVGGTRSGPDAPEPFAGTLTYISAPTFGNVITINGVIGSGEWDNANKYISNDFDLYVQQDGTYLYIAVVVKADSVVNSADYCAIFFDTDHGAEALPQSEDRQFRATDPDGSVQFEDYNGDNTATWVSGFSASTWDTEGALDTDKMVYEYQISFIDVWGRSDPSVGQIAGFAVEIHDDDESANYHWGSSSVSTTNLATWGDLVYVPEFPTIAIPIMICAIIPFIAFRARRRRLHA